jgi:hypothetical protein
MSSETYAAAEPQIGTPMPNVWNGPTRRSFFGDAAVLIFLLAQCADGVFTYVGVSSFGIGIEANPIIASLMSTFGHGAGLAGAKLVAGMLGIMLHICEVHLAVAVLAGFYITAAIVPWVSILFF